jgi:hypothetical protein
MMNNKICEKVAVECFKVSVVHLLGKDWEKHIELQSG